MSIFFRETGTKRMLLAQSVECNWQALIQLLKTVWFNSTSSPTVNVWLFVIISGKKIITNLFVSASMFVNRTQIWLSGSRYGFGNEYHWFSNGKAIGQGAYTNWAPGQPNRQNYADSVALENSGTGNPASGRTSYQWNDLHWNTKAYSLCEATKDIVSFNFKPWLWSTSFRIHKNNYDVEIQSIITDRLLQTNY